MAEILDLMGLEPNIPPTDFGVYTTAISAPPKFGKSTWCTLYEKPLILDFEEGTKGKVVYRVQVAKWTDVKKYIRQLAKEPKLKEKYKTICFDTVNYALEGCKQYIMDEYQANHPDKLIDTFNKIPYGGGKELLAKEFKGEINKLKRAGYGIVLVSHIKDKMFDKETELERTKTVPDLSDSERNLISAMADFLLLGEFETEVIEPAKKDSNGKVIKEAITETKRVLYLRTNEKAESGFRWDDCPEKIAFDFEVFKEVFKEAVENEIEKGKLKFSISDKKVNEIRTNLDSLKKREEESAINEENIKDKIETDEINLKELVIKIQEKAKELRSEKIEIKKIKEAIGNEGKTNTIKTVEEAQTVLDKLEALKK
jgi:hypothetical protein